MQLDLGIEVQEGDAGVLIDDQLRIGQLGEASRDINSDDQGGRSELQTDGACMNCRHDTTDTVLSVRDPQS